MKERDYYKQRLFVYAQLDAVSTIVAKARLELLREINLGHFQSAPTDRQRYPRLLAALRRLPAAVCNLNVV